MSTRCLQRTFVFDEINEDSSRAVLGEHNVKRVRNCRVGPSPILVSRCEREVRVYVPSAGPLRWQSAVSSEPAQAQHH